MYQQTIRKEINEKKKSNQRDKTTKKILFKTKKKCQFNFEVHQLQRNWFTQENIKEIKSHNPKSLH